MEVLKYKVNGEWKDIIGLQGKQGVQGSQGETGKEGEAATVEVGEVKTLKPEENAFVENVGTDTHAVFNFGLPKGNTGSVDESKIPTKISQLDNDSGYLTSIPSEYKTKTENDNLYQEKGNYLTSFTESDPTVPSHVKAITEADIEKWNSGGGGGSSSSLDVYYSEEHRIGTWIDGSPLYRRVINGKIGTTLGVWNPLASFPFRQATKISGVWGGSFVHEQYPVPYTAGEHVITLCAISNNKTVCEYHNYDYPNGATIQVIIEYIK